MHTPPIVGEDVEDGKENDEERGRPFGLETNCDHDTGTETKQRHENTSDAP